MLGSLFVAIRRWRWLRRQRADLRARRIIEHEIDRGELLARWLVAYDARLNALESVHADAVKMSATLGRQVRVELPGETFEGEATELTADGHLVVAGRVIAAGDVTHLRVRR